MAHNDDPPPRSSSRLGRLRANAGAATEPLVDAAGSAIDAAGSAFDSAVQGIRELPGMRVRRVRQLGHRPLASLPDLYPESKRARRVDIGTRQIPVDEIRGTAVGGGAQRGGDFLPLKPFRGRNWAARWQRLRRAHEALEALPPIDVVKYDGAYWVVDGHNRVAMALYNGQPEIDASVVELVPPGAHRTEALGSLEAEMEASRSLRGRALQPDDPER